MLDLNSFQDPFDAVCSQFFNNDCVIDCIECFLKVQKNRHIQFLQSIFSYQESVVQIKDVTVEYSFEIQIGFL